MRNKPSVRATAIRKTMLAVLLAAAFTPAFAGDPVALDIPAQSLAAALKTLSSQANIQILIPSEQVQDKTSQPLKGSYTTEQALEKLLQDTGLTWTEKEGVIAVKVAPPPPPEQVMEMSPIEVRGGKEAQCELAKRNVAPVASTGTKTDTPLMETPLAIQVVPQQVLQDQKATTLEQALTNVSGVRSSTGEGGGYRETFWLRGFYTQPCDPPAHPNSNIGRGRTTASTVYSRWFFPPDAAQSTQRPWRQDRSKQDDRGSVSCVQYTYFAN